MAAITGKHARPQPGTPERRHRLGWPFGWPRHSASEPAPAGDAVKLPVAVKRDTWVREEPYQGTGTSLPGQLGSPLDAAPSSGTGHPLDDDHLAITGRLPGPAEMTTADPAAVAPPWVSANLAAARPGTAPALLRDHPGLARNPGRAHAFVQVIQRDGSRLDAALTEAPAYIGLDRAEGHRVAGVRLRLADGRKVIIAADVNGINTIMIALAHARDDLVYGTASAAAGMTDGGEAA